MRPRDNPFRSERLDHGPYRLHGATWPELITRLLAHQGPCSVVGPHGAGKTRLLRELCARLQAQGVPTLLLRLDREARPAAPGPGVVVLVDGLEAQPPWKRWWWSGWWRRARAVVVARHVHGREPVLHECRPDFALTRALVDDLGAHAGAVIDDLELRALLQAHPGDLRTVLRALYDRFASHEGPQPS
jgi:hypothetical protein